MEKKPLVTIRTSCYNHEDYLGDYFESIINQTYQNIELVLFDDASPDNSQKVIEEWLPKLEERFVRVIYIPREKNVGLIKNCNDSIKLAQGKYIFGFASDDVMLPKKIENSVNFLENNEEYGMVYSDIIEYRNGKAAIKSRFGNKAMPEGDIFQQLLLKGNFIPAPSVCIRSDVFNVINGYDDKLAVEDYQMWLSIAEKYQVGYLGEPTALYRIHDKSLSHNKETRIKACEDALKVKFRFANSPRIDAKVKKNIKKNAYKKNASVCFVYKDRQKFKEYYFKYEKFVKATNQRVAPKMLIKKYLLQFRLHWLYKLLSK